MRKYSLIIIAVMGLASCNVKVSTDGDTKETSTATTATETTAAAGIKDPVCGMAMDGEQWTEMSVNGTDTTRFCSPHCKEQFEKNPAKYQKPAPAKS